MHAEALVSSVILLALVSQSQRFFGESLNAMGSSRRNDSIISLIQADLEDIRHCVSLYALPTSINTSSDDWCNDVTSNQTMPNGQLIYLPDETSCFDNTLANDLIDQGVLPADGKLDTNSFHLLKNASIVRTINVDPGNSNLLQVTYSMSGTTADKADQTFTMSIPAQGWCP